MKKLAVGILAHVDAGKTTLSEGMLYCCGCLKKLGRVDHRDAFLDTHELERERGITIFAKQAVLPLEHVEITLLDTPGHVDFSAEAERTLRVLDCAILVISGSEGVQAHTLTLWRLLRQYHVPTVLFINKMDLPSADRAALLAEIRRRLSEGCVDFGADQEREALLENIAMCSDEVFNRYLDQGAISDGEISDLVAAEELFPCLFGSALRLEGVDGLLDCLERYAPRTEYPAEFGARVYKISRDPQGTRLTYLKVTGGTLQVKALLTGEQGGWEEKVDQIRIYSGSKYRTAERAEAGTICAVTGLSRTFPGEGLGGEPAAGEPVLEPVLTYRLLLPQGCDPYAALLRLRELEEEDPQLRIVWNEQLREIHIQLMGEVQMEILKRLIAGRYGWEVTFGAGNIVYRETITEPVLGVGHFEPLRHYAEVHLLMEPGERGSGLRFAAACGEDMLDRNWQRLILTHLAERTHPGVLTGAPITDMKITLVAGKAHVKHTEGGDFRQATYRAIRQGLMSAQAILLEPWYDFRLEVPTEYVGRAMTDLQRMSGRMEPAETGGETTVLTGSAPVACLRDYAAEVAAYTRGQGRLFCTLRGYEACHNQEDVVAASGYDPERDTDNPADSVFCSHGAGVTVKWNEAPARMHADSGLKLEGEAEGKADAPARPSSVVSRTGGWEQDKELQAIFERTYGPVKRRDFLPTPPKREKAPAEGRVEIRPRDTGPEYLLVDGYNIIFAWDELKAVARDNLDAARQMLMDLLSNYQGYKKNVVILVFDAYKVPRSVGEVVRYHNIYVVYTKEAETADAYIEKATYEIGKKHRVRVATSDGTEQLIILGHGALRLSARAFKDEVEQVGGQIAAALVRNNSQNRGTKLSEHLGSAEQRHRE